MCTSKFKTMPEMSVLNRVGHVGLVGHSRGSFPWVKLLDHSCGLNLWVILVGGSNLSVKLVGYSHGSFSLFSQWNDALCRRWNKRKLKNWVKNTALKLCIGAHNNPVKHPRRRFLQKQITGFSCEIFLEKAPSQKSDRVRNTPL